MGLRRKAVLIAVAIVVVTSLSVYLVSYRVIQEKFDRLEERRVRLSLDRIQNAFRHEAEHLETLAADYATWDRTYDYMAQRYPAYERSELSDETFTSYHLRFFILIDGDGTVALCRDYNAMPSKCLRNSEIRRIVAAASSIAGPRWELSGSALLPLDGPAVMLAVRPVLKTNGAGPSRGALVIARPVDQQMLQNASRLLASSLEVFRAGDRFVPFNAAFQRASVSGTEHQVVEVVDEDRIAGYLRLDDFEGQPGLVIRTELNRDLHREGAMVQRLLFGELFGIVLLMAVAVFILLQRAVLKPILALSATANSITGSGDLSARADIRGSDEFTSLGRAFNTMLDELEASRGEMLVVQETLEYRVRHDSLTGVLNRNAITQELMSESTRCLREGTTLGVMMIDLDHFKRINDAFGHAMGDEALRRTCDVIRSSLRPYDRVGRFGGEEFLILAPHVTRDNAIHVAERIRSAVSATAHGGTSGYYPTVSIGVTVSDGSGDWQDVVSTADSALYHAKNAGRNRVEFCACSTSQPTGYQSTVNGSTLAV